MAQAVKIRQIYKSYSLNMDNISINMNAGLSTKLTVLNSKKVHKISHINDTENEKDMDEKMPAFLISAIAYIDDVQERMINTNVTGGQ